MPSFARELEQTLHNALSEASGRKHEYATLEHLLLALIDDVHASRVMEACGVGVGELKDQVRHYLDNELEALKVDQETGVWVGVVGSRGRNVPLARRRARIGSFPSFIHRSV